MEFVDRISPDFGLKIDSQEGSERSERVFQAKAGLLEAFAANRPGPDSGHRLEDNASSNIGGLGELLN